MASKSPITLPKRGNTSEGQCQRDHWKAEKFLAQHCNVPAGTCVSCDVRNHRYTITLQEVSNYAISYITGLLITVTGILLGLSGLTPLSKSLERMKLQVTLTITTLLWLVAIIMIAQTYGFSFTVSTPFLRYLFLTGVALFTLLVLVYSTSTIEATRQRLLAEQVAKASNSGKTTS